jgi:hypothetical protein
MSGMNIELSAEHIGVFNGYIRDWIKDYTNKMYARRLAPTRTFKGLIEKRTRWDRVAGTRGASITAVGEPMDAPRLKQTDEFYKFYLLNAGFDIHEDEIATLKPEDKKEMVDLNLSDMHDLEDLIFFQGSTKYGIDGISQYGAANPKGKLAGADIVGTWDPAAEDNPDIYADLVKAKNYLDSTFGPPAFLVGNERDVNNLFNYDSEKRRTIWETAKALFRRPDGKEITSFYDFVVPLPNDDDWMLLPEGKVYMLCYSKQAFEFVRHKDPKATQRPVQRGGLIPIEFPGWVSYQKHKDSFAVEIATVKP